VQSSLNQSINASNEARYNKLNHKLEYLSTVQHKHHNNQHNTTVNHSFHARVKNLLNIEFNKKELSIIETGQNYAFESNQNIF
jgi:hypothetical protein